MWDLPGPGLKPMSPALAGGFLTTVPPGKPLGCLCGQSLWQQELTNEEHLGPLAKWILDRAKMVLGTAAPARLSGTRPRSPTQQQTGPVGRSFSPTRPAPPSPSSPTLWWPCLRSPGASGLRGSGTPVLEVSASASCWVGWEQPSECVLGLGLSPASCTYHT